MKYMRCGGASLIGRDQTILYISMFSKKQLILSAPDIDLHQLSVEYQSHSRTLVYCLCLQVASQFSLIYHVVDWWNRLNIFMILRRDTLETNSRSSASSAASSARAKAGGFPTLLSLLEIPEPCGLVVNMVDNGQQILSLSLPHTGN